LYSGINTKYKELTIKADELNSIINLSNLGMAMVSDKGNIIICNNSLRDILDIQSNIIGKNIDELEIVREINSMKKLVIILISIISMVSLTACKKSNESKYNNLNNKESGQTTIEMDLDKNYDTSDPFVNARLFCVSN
ncbi:hypothetical protein QEG_3649, partial [Clostridioides difficile CD127]